MPRKATTLLIAGICVAACLTPSTATAEDPGAGDPGSIEQQTIQSELDKDAAPQVHIVLHVVRRVHGATIIYFSAGQPTNSTVEYVETATTGKGETEPIASNKTTTGKALNRRVTITTGA